ncbi:threonine--tRNA ligase [Clostridium beijerinckii]|uniref:Threonine--tRNA ligase n=1 Tax=Clostridium beijerinckii TaxID=1520 RepID=A0AAW3WAU1_CLOBE|nr:threonine--tRNA ligase [Clostridium beijerinckii]MBC2458548.1 threonine--tRNA ligase [Clostridium beijerinckii]MBC2476034.1 threonine--tRNA ligase [Clostridium beijerinckii]NOV60865.1 threonyl-tRNA synthetase [Clostridium beijerinckii]NOV73045.1 threonyl-tRNA synthetase [Clostridium beijerinckii]NOW33271.1 threonyl-tRNA synthetase [Clostridium beijerinckii]
MINIKLKDGLIKEIADESSIYDLANSISKNLAKVAVVGEVNGTLVDLTYKLKNNDEVNILTYDDEKAVEVIRHSTSHVMAQAVKRIYKDSKLAIGPAINNGFYYDFDIENSLSNEDLNKIEAEMNKIINENLSFERIDISRDEAIKLMEEKGETYKVELIKDLPEAEKISLYKQGDYIDLCRGPHIPSTKYIKAFKLLSVAGAYWRGNEKNKMLQRVYGVAFSSKKELEVHLHNLEEAKKRDHRKLGKELKLFTFAEEGPGFPFMLPKGVILKNTLIDFWRKLHYEDGYVEIETPIMLNKKLWETSGHWYHYRENMYTSTIDEEEFALKPMNCPGGMLVYKSESHSYRDFPMRVGELGRVHRHELSGALHGLMRVRAFTQDDAHIFMLPDQIKSEIKGVINLIDKVYSKFGFKYNLELSTRPEDSMGSDEEWELAESSLKGALDELNLEYKINEGDGAFYGPKIDFHLEDSIGRTWQCGTIQLDFQLPQRFELEYVGSDGEKHRPIVIHRVVFGSIERFIGILIEHFAGKFPTWLSPVQVKILPISNKFNSYSEKIKDKLSSEGIRVEIDQKDEKIGYKIREARNERVPYIIIVGEKEEAENNISLRSRSNGDEGTLNLEDLIERINNEVKNKAL